MKKAFAFVLIVFTIVVNVSAQQNSNIYTVFFASNSASLDLQPKLTIDSLSVAYKNAGFKGMLSIKGYADALGSNAYNLRLSKQRVLTVKTYLANLGVPKAAISLENGYGEQEAAQNDKNIEKQYLDRRVDIFWTHNGKTTEVKEDSVVTFTLEKVKAVKVGQLMRLKNINFEPGSDRFLPQAYLALKELLDAMNANPKLVIEIQGHICCMPSTSYYIGENLSHFRAKAVINYLIGGGIAERRMTYKGFSNTKPLVYPELTEEDRIANRRVEVKILAK